MSEKRTLRERAEELKEEFLECWTRVHDDPELRPECLRDMDALILAIRKEALEEAARVADGLAIQHSKESCWTSEQLNTSQTREMTAADVATAIRALAEATDKQ